MASSGLLKNHMHPHGAITENQPETVPHDNPLVEGSLETKVPTIRTDEKHSQEEAELGRNSDVEKVRMEKLRDGESQKREDAGARKGGKLAKHFRSGALLAVAMLKKCTTLRRETHVEVKMHKTHHARTTFVR